MPLIMIFVGSSNTKRFTTFIFISCLLVKQRRKDFQNKHISGMWVLNTGNALLSLEQI